MAKLLISLTICASLLKASQSSVDIYTSKDLAEIRTQLAAKKTRFAGKDLVQYGNHYTMLAYRDSTGSSEIHEHEADIFVIEDGDATLVTGGKMNGGHLQKPGEWRGTSLEGGVKRPLKTGDIVHIPAGVPHQLLVTAGKPVTYFVVKVTGQ